MELQAQQHLVQVSPHSAAGSVYPACGALRSPPLPVYLVYHHVYHHSLAERCIAGVLGSSWRLHDQAVPMLVYHSVRTWFKTGCELVFPVLLH